MYDPRDTVVDGSLEAKYIGFCSHRLNTNSMKKILVVTSRPVFPVTAGDRLRIYNLCKYLAEIYIVDLFFISPDDKQAQITCDYNIFNNVKSVVVSSWESKINSLIAFALGRPMQTRYYITRKVRAALGDFCVSHDIVLFHLVRTSELANITDKPKIIEMTDAISMNYERLSDINTERFLIRKLIYRLERARLNEYEKRMIHTFDSAILVSEVDKKYLLGGSRARAVHVFGNGVNEDFFNYEYRPDMKTILFIGNMSTMQNFDAVVWFARSVMPLISELGNYQFRVVGEISDHNFRFLNSINNVFATGSVDSVLEASRNAFVAVCPMRVGAGIQNKVLEYMAMGIPTISSALGYEGLRATPGVDLMIADSPIEISDQMMALRHDEIKRDSLSINARRYVRSNHTWAAQLDGLDKVFESAIS